MTEYVETIVRDGKKYVRRFRDMDGGCHYKWVAFHIGRKKYPIGSFDIVRHEAIDWEHTRKVRVSA